MKQFDYKEFSKKIRQIRFESGLSQVKMSDNAELTRFTINAWENGKSVPGVSNLYQFCVTYGVSMDWLCGLSDKKKFEKGGGAYSGIENS